MIHPQIPFTQHPAGGAIGVKLYSLGLSHQRQVGLHVRTLASSCSGRTCSIDTEVCAPRQGGVLTWAVLRSESAKSKALANPSTRSVEHVKHRCCTFVPEQARAASFERQLQEALAVFEKAWAPGVNEQHLGAPTSKWA